MNRKYAISAAIALVAAGTAWADDITIDPNPFVSTASRAQVQAELMQFRTAGTDPWADDYNQLAQFRSGMTRAEATAGFLASRAAVAAYTSEDSGSSYMARMNAPAIHRTTDVAHAE
jgi:hypothetical protein